MSVIDLNAEALELVNKTRNVVQRIPKPTAPAKGKFDDEEVLKLRESVKLGKNFLSRGLMKEKLRRFYDFYFQGIINSKDSVWATLFDCVLLARGGNGFIFKEDDADRSFYTPNSSIGENISTTEPSPVTTPSFPPSMSKEDQDSILRLFYHVDTDNQREFRDVIAEMIGGFNSAGDMNPEEARFLALTGFLAMTLFRCAVKDVTQMTNAFLKQQYKENLTAVIGWPIIIYIVYQ